MKLVEFPNATTKPISESVAEAAETLKGSEWALLISDSDEGHTVRWYGDLTYSDVIAQLVAVIIGLSTVDSE